MLEMLTNKIVEWGLARGIIQHGKPMGQAVKTLEETAELIDALNKGDEAAVRDAIGDIYVTLVMCAGTMDMNIEDCIDVAYHEIKDRKGYLGEDGIFVKEN